ncbi:MAG: hypothetical protein ABIK52_08510, partial [Bacteroidota bacterium]
MKKKLFFFFIIVTFGIAAFGQYITILGKQFKDENGNDFEPIVCNYGVCIAIDDTNDISTTYVSPHHGFGSSLGIDCDCQASCDKDLVNDFKQILFMGFNTIRIMGIHPYFLKEGYQQKEECDWVCPEDAFYLPTEFTGGSLECYSWYAMHEPFENDSISQRLFELTNHLIQVISGVEYEGNKLKVILIAGGHTGIHSHNFPDVYSDYLYVLSDTLSKLFSSSAKTTLMAYDLWNEPASVWPEDTIGHSKQDVCEKVKMWYDTVKAGDPHHLVTLGGKGFKDIW